MNCQLYLGLVGPIKAVASFANAVNVPRAVVEELGSKVTNGLPKDWQWRTPRQSARTEFPEDSIALLLQESESLLDEIKKRSHQLFAVVTMICQYEETERASGCYLSSETINLLSRFGAALEIDAVLKLTPPEI